MCRYLPATFINILLGLAFVVSALTLGGAHSATADSLRDRINQGTVGVISGDLNGTYLQMSSDLSVVLDEGDELRVITHMGKGSVQNILDLLYLRGVDIGIVQSDVLEYFTVQKIHPKIKELIRYIVKLHNDEVHLLVREDIKTFKDLRGQKIGFGVPGSGAYITASILFATLGVGVQPIAIDNTLALDRLKKGEIAGLVYVVGKPARLFRDISSEDGVKLLSIPQAPQLLKTYVPAVLTSEDYPQLVSADSSVKTFAVGTVMAVYNWQPDQWRYVKVEKFVRKFFERLDDLQKAPRHPKWTEVDLTAQVPGWERLEPAVDWLSAKENGAADQELLRAEFERFIREAISRGESAPTSKDALFNQFERWQASRNQ